MHRAPGKGTCMTQRHKFRVSGGSNLGISNNAHGQISVLSLITVSCSQILVPKTHFLQTFLWYRDNLKRKLLRTKNKLKRSWFGRFLSVPWWARLGSAVLKNLWRSTGAHTQALVCCLPGLLVQADHHRLLHAWN